MNSPPLTHRSTKSSYWTKEQHPNQTCGTCISHQPVEHWNPVEVSSFFLRGPRSGVAWRCLLERSARQCVGAWWRAGDLSAAGRRRVESLSTDRQRGVGPAGGMHDWGWGRGTRGLTWATDSLPGGFCRTSYILVGYFSLKKATGWFKKEDPRSKGSRNAIISFRVKFRSTQAM
jgi:hypothetical protein